MTDAMLLGFRLHSRLGRTYGVSKARERHVKMSGISLRNDNGRLEKLKLLIRIIHDPLTVTADMAVLPGVRNPATYCSNRSRIRASSVATWHAHLYDFATPFLE